MMDNGELFEGDSSDDEPVTETTLNPNGFFADSNDKVRFKRADFCFVELFSQGGCESQTFHRQRVTTWSQLGWMHSIRG